MSEVRTLSSIRALIDRSRAHITPDDLWKMMMNDPGTGRYVAAYEEVLKRGVDALLERTAEGSPRFDSFEITENLFLAHTDASMSVTHRWFSVLATGIDFMRSDVDSYPPLSTTLANLLTDSFALASAHAPEAPLDLVPVLCRELKASDLVPYERVMTLVTELLTATLTDAEIEHRCRDLQAYHDDFQEYQREDGERNPNFARRPEFIWGAVLDRDGLPVWLELTRAHFPSSPALAGETRERLLLAAERWLGTS